MILAVQDPEGILPPPVPHHITRRGYEKKIAEDAEYKEKVERQLQADKEARRQAREVSYACQKLNFSYLHENVMWCA